MKRDHITSEIIKASKAIRKKQLAMRMGQAEAQDLLEKQFKPITEPLQKILKTGVIKQEIDMDAIKSEISQDLKRNLETPLTEISKLQTPPAPTQTSTQPTPQRRKTPVSRRLAEADVDYDPFTEEEHQEIQTEKSFQQFRDEYQSMIERDPERVDEFLEQYDMTPRVYIDGLLTDTTGEYDTTTGVHFDPILNKLKLGKSVLDIDGKDLVVGGTRCTGTAGLYELIFKSKPTGYKKDDLDCYRDILNRTNVHRRGYDPKQQIKGNKGYNVNPLMFHRRGYDPKQQIKGNKGYKHVNIINPLMFRSRASAVTGSIQGRGQRMQFRRSTHQTIVDKFGRHLRGGTEEIHSSFLPHTLDGNYDVGGKRLCNIKDPVDAQDCATMIYVAKQNKELRRYLDSVAIKLDGIIWKQLPALELREKDLKSKVNIHEKEIGNLLLLENKTNVRLQSLEDKMNDSERRLKLKLDFLENGLNNKHG
ncbi:hypothetical protein QE152_g4865 [Popillia japonica]|uniref:DUF8207 domain-containing protein n=1 Tax=Popillia japonica TaxID=7064 RepID=A0AAW1MZ16_POPJA